MKIDNGDRFILVHKDNNTYCIGDGVKGLKIFMRGRNVNDYTCFCVENGGLERFFLPKNLSELDKLVMD